MFIGFIVVVGLLLAYLAVFRIIQRREDYEHDLENVEYEKKTSLFWGINPKDEDNRINEIKKRGYGTRWERFKFSAVTLGMGIVGGLLLLFVYLNQEPTKEPWQRGQFELFMWGVFVVICLSYQHSRTTQKLERHIRWLEEMLRAVKRHMDDDLPKVSLDEMLQARLNSIRE